MPSLLHLKNTSTDREKNFQKHAKTFLQTWLSGWVRLGTMVWLLDVEAAEFLEATFQATMTHCSRVSSPFANLAYWFWARILPLLPPRKFFRQLWFLLLVCRWDPLDVLVLATLAEGWLIAITFFRPWSCSWRLPKVRSRI